MSFFPGDFVRLPDGGTGYVGSDWTDAHFKVHVDPANPQYVAWYYVDELRLIKGTKFRMV